MRRYIFDTNIASPIMSMADVVIAMSSPTLERFESQVKPGKTLIFDSDQIKKTDLRKVSMSLRFLQLKSPWSRAMRDF